MAENTDEKKDQLLEDEYTADEIHNADLGDLVAENIASEVPDESQPENPASEEKQEEQTETPIEEKKEDEAPQLPQTQPAINTEELSKNIVSQVVEALAGDTKTGQEKQDIKNDIWANAPWVKENRTPSYTEALDYTIKAAQPKLVEETAAKVKEMLDKEVEEEEKTLQEQEEQQKKQQEETQKQWNTYWDAQLADLESKNLIPKIVNKNDPNDPGVKTRVALFTKMREAAEENGKNNKPVSLNLKEIYYEHYKPEQDNKRDPKLVPVAGARKGMSPQEEEEFSYEEIHNAQGFTPFLKSNK